MVIIGFAVWGQAMDLVLSSQVGLWDLLVICGGGRAGAVCKFRFGNGLENQTNTGLWSGSDWGSNMYGWISPIFPLTLMLTTPLLIDLAQKRWLAGRTPAQEFLNGGLAPVTAPFRAFYLCKKTMSNQIIIAEYFFFTNSKCVSVERKPSPLITAKSYKL